MTKFDEFIFQEIDEIRHWANDETIEFEPSYYNRMRRAYNAAKPKWQPIETAPVNEMVLVLWDDKYICSATYEKEYDEMVWYMYGDTVLECEPTHWMPLLEPPEDVLYTHCNT